jgi:uncharacterized membrane protein YdfJ with MMPL/SSD domain
VCACGVRDRERRDDVTQENAQSGVGESGRASVALRDAFPKHVSEEVLIRSAAVRATDPSFRAVVEDVQRRLAATPYTRAFESPYAAANRARISADGHSALLRFEIAGTDSEAKDRVAATLRATAAAQAAHRDFAVEQFGGSDSASGAALAQLRDTLIPATVGSVPDTTAEVTGQTASSKDFNDTMSMDYHVFILSRIREVFDRGRSTEEAVAHGIKSTAGVVTSAAVVMVSVFAIFATLSLLIFKQLGIGLAVAVLLDATLVRGVLLPATMKLLGDWNWYLPGWLEWLPHVGPGDGRGLPPDTSRPQPEAHPA